jgi:tight adherence protein C
MMTYVIVMLIACSAGLVIVAVAQLLPARSARVGRRLAELEHASTSPFGVIERRQRQARRARWESVLRELGDQVASDKQDIPELKRRMMQAGFQNPGATSVFWGLRITLPLVLGGLGLLLVPFAGQTGLLVTLVLGIAGWIGPSFYVDKRIRRRQKEIQLALADTLDLLVTCVEAGLGMNQAMLRVSEEIRHLSPEMSRELAMVNLEIRAGRPREDALRNLGERTGLEDLQSLTSMLIQADRLGTSVAQALRIQSETLRTKRRQRAEEEAAKTVVKILFPLVFFIFPALFVVILGPAAISIMELFGG